MTSLNLAPDFARDKNEEILVFAACSVKKKTTAADGVLFLTTTRVVWCATASINASISVPYATISSHQYSPATAATVMLKLSASTGESFVFEFTSRHADKDRNDVREILSQSPAQHNKQAAAAAGGAAAETNASVKKEATKPVTVKPEPRAIAGGVLAEGEEESAATGKSASTSARRGMSELDARSRAAILAKDEQVRLLYDELVTSGIIGDEEFWQMRAEDMKAIATRGRAQQKGVSTGGSFDLEPSARSATREHYKIDAATTRAVFVANPAIAKAFKVLVPDKMTEQEFWVKYIHAKQFHKDKQASTQKRVRTKATAEDDVLSRALEDADKAAASASDARPHVPLAVDIGANDSVLDTAHYGVHTEPTSSRDARSASVVSQFNRHGALVVGSHDTSMPSILPNLRPVDAPPPPPPPPPQSAARAGATSTPADGDRDGVAAELAPASAPAPQRLHLEQPVAARRGVKRALVTLLLDTAAAAQHADALVCARPAIQDCKSLTYALAQTDRGGAAALRERKQARRGGGDTLEAVYATADVANSAVLAELQLSADAADALKASMYKQFARVNELLRHFWHSHWRVAMAAKVARIVAALRISHDEIEHAKTQLPVSQRGTIAPIMLEMMNRVDVALDTYERQLASKTEPT